MAGSHAPAHVPRPPASSPPETQSRGVSRRSARRIYQSTTRRPDVHLPRESRKHRGRWVGVRRCSIEPRRSFHGEISARVHPAQTRARGARRASHVGCVVGLHRETQEGVRLRSVTTARATRDVCGCQTLRRAAAMPIPVQVRAFDGRRAVYRRVLRRALPAMLRETAEGKLIKHRRFLRAKVWRRRRTGWHARWRSCARASLPRRLRFRSREGDAGGRRRRRVALRSATADADAHPS